jgi:hypothetical protein
MYQYANGSREHAKGIFIKMEGNKLNVMLAQQSLSIYFTRTHIADLRAVIEADENGGLNEDDA